MVKLVDTPALGAGRVKPMRVRVSLSAYTAYGIHRHSSAERFTTFFTPEIVPLFRKLRQDYLSLQKIYDTIIKEPILIKYAKRKK